MATFQFHKNIHSYMLLVTVQVTRHSLFSKPLRFPFSRVVETYLSQVGSFSGGVPLPGSWSCIRSLGWQRPIGPTSSNHKGVHGGILVLPITGHGNMLVITGMGSRSFCLCTSGLGFPCGFDVSFGNQDSAWLCKDCSDLLHSHSLAKVFLPLNLPTSPPPELQNWQYLWPLMSPSFPFQGLG